MSNPVTMETNDLESGIEAKDSKEDDNVPELTQNVKNVPMKEKVPHLPLHMDDSFLMDEAHVDAEDFHETSEGCYIIKEEMEFDHGEWASEMDYTEEIILPTFEGADPSMVLSESELSSDVIVQSNAPCEPAVDIITNAHNVITAATVAAAAAASVPTSQSNTWRDHSNNMGSQINLSTLPSLNSQLQSISNLQGLIMQQRIIAMQQAGIMTPRMTDSTFGGPNLGNFQNFLGTAPLPITQHQTTTATNLLQLRDPRLRASMQPTGPFPNRMSLPRLPMQGPRMNAPLLNVRFPRPVAPHTGMLHGVKGMSSLSSLSVQALRVREQALKAQLNILKNMCAMTLRPNTANMGIQSRRGSIPQINTQQNLHMPESGETISVPPLGIQAQTPHLALPASVVRHPSNNQQILMNAQQNMNVNPMVANLSQLAAVAPRIARNVSQLIANRPQLRVPQMPTNMLQFRAPQLGSVSQLKLQQMAASMQQLNRNVSQLNVSQGNTNISHMSAPPFSSNMSAIGAPQLQSNMQRFSIPRMPVNMPQVLRNIPPLMQQQTTNSSRVSSVLGKIPQLQTRQATTVNMSRFRMPIFPRNVPQMTLQQAPNVPRLGVPLVPTSSSNGAMQPRITNMGEINMPRSLSTGVPQIRLQSPALNPPQVSSKFPQAQLPQFRMSAPQRNMPLLSVNMSRTKTQPSGGNVCQKGVLDLSARASSFERQRQTLSDLGVKRKTLETSRKDKQHGSHRKATGVTQQLSGVVMGTSQQSASAALPGHRQIRIVSQLEEMMHKGRLNQREEIILKYLQKNRAKQQLAALNLWKRYEKYWAVKGIHRSQLRIVMNRILKYQHSLIQRVAELKKIQLTKTLSRW